MAQVALAWILSRDFITAPIVGTTSLDKLKDLLGTFFFFFFFGKSILAEGKKETVKESL